MLDYAKQGVKLSEKLNYKKGLADCLHVSGIFYFTQRNSSRALQYFIKSLTIREKIGDKDNFGNVTEVAFQVGFSSSNYFTRCFKERFHWLPHTYANE